MKGALFFIMFLSACGYKNTQLDLNNNTNNANKPFDSGSLDYQTIRTQIFQNHCFECHTQEAGNEGDVNLETYANTITNITNIKTEIEAGSMPKRRPPLSPENKQMLLDWIAAGAPEVANSGDTNPNNPNNPGTPDNPTPGNPNPDPCEDENQDDDQHQHGEEREHQHDDEDQLMSRRDRHRHRNRHRNRGNDHCNKITLELMHSTP